MRTTYVLYLIAWEIQTGAEGVNPAVAGSDRSICWYAGSPLLGNLGQNIQCYAVGAENLCHQAIFVDDATRAVMPPDPEMIQVGHAIRQGPQRRGLV